MTREIFDAWAAEREQACSASKKSRTQQTIRAAVRERAKALGNACPEWAAPQKLRASDSWDAWLAARVAAHEAATGPVTRAGVRAAVRKHARKFRKSPPTWALEAESHKARNPEQPRFGAYRAAKKTPAITRGAPIAVVPANAPVRPLTLPAELVAWRKSHEMAIVHLRRDGRVILDNFVTRRTFASVEAACEAVA